ncbi:MAG: glycosyltransferase family 2 protein [Eubacterium sp.]|nr:glycosyltransferase family 2 protein [Eubacterium sp.]
MQRKLSVVIPTYNEEESLEELYQRIIKNVVSCMNDGLLTDYELIFVDDGSTDASVLKIRSIHDKDERVHMISFRKNFGKAAALQAGFRNVTGDIVLTIDADLQDDPSEIKNFIQKLDEGFDLVSGWKVNRLDPLEKRLPSKLFNKATAKLSGVKLHDFNCGFKAYRREVVDSMDVYGELHRYLPVLAYRKGYRIAEIPVHHNQRKFGKSKYGMERYLRGLFDSFSVSFLSKFYDRPMYFFGRIGLASSVVGIFICLKLTRDWMKGCSIGKRPLLLLGVLLLLLGVQSASTGLIGDMLVDATFRSRYTEYHVREKI